MPQQLPDGVTNGTYQIRPTDAGTVEIEVREFIGWWDTEQAHFVRRVKEAKPEVIRLNIASEGGFIADALAIHDFLREYPARVEVEISGLTASAATVIALAGDSVRMSENALFLVHHASGGAWGKAEDLESYTRGLRKVNGRILNIYAKKTGQPEEVLDELMAAEEWLTADEALAWGFIDEVFTPASAPDAATAAAGLRAVAHAPAPEVLRALDLPPLPTANHKPKVRPSATMPGQTNPNPAPKPTQDPESRSEQAPQNPAPQQPENRPQPQSDPSDDVAQMRAELERIKAENARLAKERRAAAVAGLRNALAGKLPGLAVDALVELAEEADARLGGAAIAFKKPTASAKDGAEVGIIARLTDIAASLSPMVRPEQVETSSVDAEAAKARQAAYQKM